MKLLKHFILLVIIALSSNAYAQILTISENYRGNERTISNADKQIIEINSTLEIKVAKAKLLEAIQTQFPELNNTLQLELALVNLQRALRNQSAIISILEKQIATAEEQKIFFEIMDGFLSEVQTDPYLSRRYEELSEEFFTTQSFAEGNLPEPYIFSNLSNDILSIEEELKAVDADKYSVSVVAYKKDERGGDRVHIQNYDTYTSRDYYTVKRWVTSLSSENKQQLEKLTEIANENKIKQFELFNILKEKLLNEFGSIGCFVKFKNNSIEVVRTIELNDVLPTELKTKIASIQAAITKFEILYKLLNTDIKQWNIAVVLNIREEIQSLVDHLKTITTDFSDITTLMDQTMLGSKFTPIVDEFTNCHVQLNIDIENLQTGIALLFGMQTNYLANKSIGAEVVSFSLDNLPETGFINLKESGKRQSGDDLLIELILKIPSSIKDAPEQVFTLEQREFTMQLIGARSEVAIGLVFANPLSQGNLNADFKRDFFYAPSVALLLKFGSNKSYFYNEFLDFGVGLNFASPDFNTDGTPEFGAGIITTAFKDIISVGLNYNVSIDTFYWFFGINLPFNLPGLPVNTIKNEP